MLPLLRCFAALLILSSFSNGSPAAHLALPEETHFALPQGGHLRLTAQPLPCGGSSPAGTPADAAHLCLLPANASLGQLAPVPKPPPLFLRYHHVVPRGLLQPQPQPQQAWPLPRPARASAHAAAWRSYPDAGLNLDSSSSTELLGVWAAAAAPTNTSDAHTTLWLGCDARLAQPSHSLHVQASSDYNAPRDTVRYTLTLRLPCAPRADGAPRRRAADAPPGVSASDGNDTAHEDYCQTTLRNITTFTLVGGTAVFFLTWFLDSCLWLGSYGACDRVPRRRPLGTWYYTLTLGFLDALTPASSLSGPHKSPALMGCALGAMVVSVVGVYAFEPSTETALLVSSAFFPVLSAHSTRVPVWGYFCGMAFALTLGAVFTLSSFDCENYTYVPAAFCSGIVGMWCLSSLVVAIGTPRRLRAGSMLRIASTSAAWRVRELRRLDRTTYVRKLFAIPQSRWEEVDLVPTPPPPPPPSTAASAAAASSFATPSSTPPNTVVAISSARSSLYAPSRAAANAPAPAKRGRLSGFADAWSAIAGHDGLPMPSRLLGAVITSLAALSTLTIFIAMLTGAVRRLFESATNCCPSGPCDADTGTLVRCDHFHLYTDLIHYCVLGSFVLAAFVLGVDLVLSLGRFRQALLHGFRTGQLPLGYSPSPVKAILGTIRFAGLQVAFSVGACTVLFALFLLVVVFIVITIVLPALDIVPAAIGKWMLKHLIWNSDTESISGVGQAIINYFVVVFFVTVFFVKDKRRPAIQRHGLFAVVDVVQFVLYAPTGIFTVIKRVTYALLAQVLYLGRMDASALPRAWERMDPAYKTYIGFLAYEMYYSNPVMLSAVYHMLLTAEPEHTRRLLQLMSSARKAHRRATGETTDRAPLLDGVGPTNGGSVTLARTTDSAGGTESARRARTRWLLAYTLLRNPDLIHDRRREGKRVRRAPPPQARQPSHAWVNVTDDDMRGVSGDAETRGARSAVAVAVPLPAPGNPFATTAASADVTAASSDDAGSWPGAHDLGAPSTVDGLPEAPFEADHGDASSLPSAAAGGPGAAQRGNPFSAQEDGSRHNVHLLRQNPFDQDEDANGGNESSA